MVDVCKFNVSGGLVKIMGRGKVGGRKFPCLGGLVTCNHRSGGGTVCL